MTEQQNDLMKVAIAGLSGAVIGGFTRIPRVRFATLGWGCVTAPRLGRWWVAIDFNATSRV